MSTAVMTEQVAEATRHSRSRIIGVVYLLYFLTAILGELFVKGIVVSGDAAATAANIQAHEPSLQLGFATGLVAIAFYIALTALFYGLFKPVSRTLSLLAAFFSLVGCAIQAFGGLFQLAPLVVLGRHQYLSAFTPEQLQVLAVIFLKLRTQALNMGLVFFGLYCLLIGCLIFKSAFLPRVLGASMALAGLGWLTFLSAPLASSMSPYIQVLGIFAEGALMLWLLVMGVNIQRWREASCE